jgi:hypothetical protein
VNIRSTFLSGSRVGLGTHSLHRLMSSTARQRLLANALELGISHYDTAPSYGAGLAETELGRFARQRRSSLLLSTKFGIPTGRLGASLPGWNYAAMAARIAKKALLPRRDTRPAARDYTPRNARSSVEASLRALGTDYVDILFVHEPTRPVLGDTEALVRTLEELKASGKVRHFGISGQESACTEIARRHAALAQVVQMEVPSDAEGLPLKGYVTPSTAGVSFWEFASGDAPSGQVPRIIERLSAAATDTALLLSTNSVRTLREAVAIFDKITAASSQECETRPRLEEGDAVV